MKKDKIEKKYDENKIHEYDPPVARYNPDLTEEEKQQIREEFKKDNGMYPEEV